MSSDTITPKQYERDVIRTTLVGATYTEDMNLIAEALAGECAELVEEIMLGAHQRERVIAEAGDILYYLVLGATRLLSVRFAAFLRLTEAYALASDDSFRLIKLMVAAGKLCDTVKKITYHKHPQDKAQLVAHLCHILAALLAVMGAEGITWQEVMAANIAKRQRRYPTGFSAQRSLARGDISLTSRA